MKHAITRTLLKTLILYTAAVVVSCTSSADKLTVDLDAVTITFVAPSADLAHYQTLARTFSAQHPGILVQVVDAGTLLTLDDTTSSPMVRLCRLAAAADIFSFGGLDPAMLGRSGAVYDLQPLLAAHDNFAAVDFLPGLLDRYRDSNGIWGIPVGVRPRVMFFNKGLFDAAGVPYPQPGWTWDDFLDKALTLTDPRSGIWGFAEQWPNESVGAFVYQHGGSLLQEGRPDFANPLAVEALNWYADLARTHRVMPSPDTLTAAQSRTRSLLQAGRVAIWLGLLGQTWSVDTGIVPLPRDRYDEAMATVPAYYVSTRTIHPEAAWRWLDFLTRQLPPPGLLPARRSVLNSSAYKALMHETTYTMYRYILEHLPVASWPTGSPWFFHAYDWLTNEGMPAVLCGESDAEDVLTEAQSRALAALAEVDDTTCGSLGIYTPSVVTSPAVQSVTFAPVTHNWLYEALARRYQEDRSGVVITITSDALIVVDGTTDLAKPPHITADTQLVPTSRKLSDLARDFRNLQPFVDGDPTVALADFYPQALAAYRRESDLWALPGEMSAAMLFYNKALFDEAGVGYPRSGWTWDDFLAAAIRLTRNEGLGKQWGFITLPGPDQWFEIPLILASQHGGALVDSRAAPSAPTLDDPAVVAAVRWYANLVHVHRVMPIPVFREETIGKQVANWDVARGLIEEGWVAMWIDSTWLLPGVDKPQMKLSLGVTPLPVLVVGGQPATWYTFTGYGISAQAPYPEEAWRWITFLSREPGIVRGVPARRSLADLTATLAPSELQPEIQQAYDATLATYADAGYDRIRAEIPWFDVVYRLYRDAVEESLRDGTDPTQTLSDAQAVAEAYMVCLEMRGGLNDNSVGEMCEEEANVPPPDPWWQ